MNNPKYLIVILPVILQEVLQGINDDEDYDLVNSIIFGFQFIEYDTYESALHAAGLYRKLQKKELL